MRKSVTIAIACATILFLGGAAWAASPRSLPHRYVPRSLDNGLTQVTTGSDGAALAAWAYRSGAEYDIAISRTDADGRWGEPVFLGRDDGRNQTQPALTLDAAGNAYLAYTDREASRVMLSVLRVGTEDWTTPLPLTPETVEASKPALLVIENRLVVAYDTGSEISMIELQLGSPESGVGVLSIVDNPDPVEYQPLPEDGDPLDNWGPQGIWVIGDDGQPVNIFLPQRKNSQSSPPPGS